ARRTRAGLDGAVEVPLEVLRGVLAGEMAIALPHLLHPRELGVLPDLPVRVRALRPLIAGPEVDRGSLGPVRRDICLREERLQLCHELLRAGRRRAAAEARTDVPTCVVDEDPLALAATLRVGPFP